MKTLTITLLGIVLSTGLFAQSATVSTDVKNNSIVVLQDLEGSVVIKNWDLPTVQVATENGGTVQLYKAENKVFISPKSDNTSNNPKYVIFMPKNVMLDWYSKSSNLNIEGEFIAVNIENENGSTRLALQPKKPSIISASLK